MVRLSVKGGVWKNTEDEILKAAVMKYGKNQWARISSLLVRKSAKQCKARWYEWLDPSIKKTEWTREEEEKLLHLAKIMPTQWRTIAPIIGRTASQCLEHYEKLLDAAQAKDGKGIDAKDDPRKLRPGEIDPNPESKAPRPDPVDMDEDEKEMLSEARARLANTKGKKAKRKAREKQLEEARRLASLQKRRELKAAGIHLRKRKHRKKDGIDYNEEIPFEKRPQAGFFDVSDEKHRSVELKNDPTIMHRTLQDLEGKRRAEEEKTQRKKDQAKMKLLKESNLPEALIKINKLNDPKMVARRSALSLPGAQMTDRELEDLAKMGAVGAAAAALGIDTTAPSVTKALLGNYSQTPQITTPGRTPRTPQSRDTVMAEAQNIIALSTSETPLKGGENTPINPTDFSGITPRRAPSQTPNPLATPAHTGSGAATPGRGGMMGGQTPMRDALSINENLGGETPLQQRKKLTQTRKKIKLGLIGLPEPANEYAVVLPELPEDAPGEKGPAEEDAEDIAARRQREEHAKLAMEMRLRSQVLQRNLPRPSAINPAMLADNKNAADALVGAEMMRLLRHDHAKFPVEPTEQRARKRKRDEAGAMLDPVSEDQLKEARLLVNVEMQVWLNKHDLTLAGVRESVSSHVEQVHNDLVFHPATKQFIRLSSASKEDKVAALRQQLELCRDWASKVAKKTAAVEQKVSLLLGGYQTRAKTLQTEATELSRDLLVQQTEMECFRYLLQQETAAAPLRKQALEKEVRELAGLERDLQQKFSSLKAQKEQLAAAKSAPTN